MKKQIIDDEKDFFDSVIERYNPKHERLTQEIYEECQQKLLEDRGYDCAEFHKYMHFSVCEGLKKYYIENDINPELFEEDIAESYMYVARHEPDQRFKDAQDKYEFVLRDVIRKLKSLHKDTLASNAHLNYDYDPNVQNLESTEQEDRMAQARHEALLKEVKSLKDKPDFKGKPDTAKRDREILLDYFGFYGEPKTLRQISDERNLCQERVRQIVARQLRRLRHPSRSKKLSDDYIK